MLLYYLIAIWVLLQLFSSRLCRLSSDSTRVSISFSSLHLSTSTLNSLSSTLLSYIPSRQRRRQRRRRTTTKRRLRGYWDLGVLLVLIALVTTQLLLVCATTKACTALFHLLISPSSINLVKRAPIPSSSPTQDLLIKPLVRLSKTDLPLSLR